MERYHLKTVSLENLMYGEGWGARYQYDDAFLTESIRAMGVLMPLVVSAGDQPRVVAGHKRAFASREAGLKEVPALVLKDELPEKDLFRLALVSNWREARHELDAAWAVKRAGETGFDETEILQEILPLLGLPSEHHWLSEFRSVVGLHAELLDALSAGRIPFRGASLLSRFSPEEQAVFAGSLANKLHLTSSQLMKTAEWLLDMMRSPRRPLAEVLQAAPLREVLDCPQKDTRQKTDLFFKHLRDLRFPRLAAQEKAFESHARDIEKGQKGLKIEAPPYFEESGFSLRLKARDPESLDHLMQVLAEKRTSMRELFKIVL